jgi:ferredoxin
MVKLTIDTIQTEVSEGTSVLQAAALLGIEIPALCYSEGHHRHPSCMVCMVKDTARGTFFPSCSMPVAEGMVITASSEEVFSLRRDSLELLLSDHVGDCEAPCTHTCPAGMNIPLMNRLIAAGRFAEALTVVKQEIALPGILGYICPAPCEKACRRRTADGTVSICLLKRFAALYGEDRPETPSPLPAANGKKVAIIGTGPAGLSAAYYLLESGHACTLFDQNELAGGALRYAVSSDTLPPAFLDAEIDEIRRMGAVFVMSTAVTPDFFNTRILSVFDAVILATGKAGDLMTMEFGLNSAPGETSAGRKPLISCRPDVFVCAGPARETQMAVRASARGKAAALLAGQYLGTMKAEGKHPFNSAFGKLSATEIPEYLKESNPAPPVEPEGGFIAGYTKESAMLEASRCMHCDCRKPVSCKLRIYAGLYGADRRRQLGPERKPLTKSFHHEMVVYEPEKCIRCGLCVEISSREERLGFTYVGRGFDVRIGVPFSETLSEALLSTAEACASACPTGALALKTREER